MANVTAICRAGKDKLSGNGRGGLGKVRSSLEPAYLLLTPTFSASELKLKLLEYPPDSRCSAGVNQQNKDKTEIKLCAWLRGRGFTNGSIQA